MDTKHATSLSTGFPELDSLLGGLLPADLIVLAGRPNMGKSTLATNIVENIAYQGAAVGAFSLEASQEQWVQRALFSTCDDAACSLEVPNILIDDTPALTPRDVCARARRLKMRHNIQLLVLDYVQLLQTGRAAAHAPCVLKALAEELGIPIIVISQLKRSLDQRDDKRPLLSDLPDEMGGSLIQNSNLILLLYRDDIYHSSSSERNLEMIVGKDRSGWSTRKTGHLPFRGAPSLLGRALRYQNQH